MHRQDVAQELKARTRKLPQEVKKNYVVIFRFTSKNFRKD